MKATLAFVVLIFLCQIGYGQKTETFRSSNGRYEGKAITSKDGKSTIVKDSAGRYLGKSTSGPSGTTYRDSRGQYAGRSTGKSSATPSTFSKGSKKK
jgi:hypothetical protein